MIFNDSKFNNHWQTLSLDELGTFKRGKSKHRPRNDKRLFENGKYPLVQTGEIKNSNLYVTSHSATYNEYGLKQSKIWPKKTLCITIAANIAETAILAYPMCFPDSVVGFNSYKGKSTEIFVHYVFTYIKRAVQNAASGSIQDNINIDFLTKLRFKIPGYLEQNQIAKILSDLDAKIERNNRINAELEGMAKLIYDYWFVQFDFPISAAQAKAIGKPYLEGKPYKSSGGKMVYNEELKREIPEGWEVKELGDIANITTGKLDSNAEVVNGEYPFFTCASNPTRTDSYAFDDKVILIAGNNAAGNFHLNRYKGKFNAYQRTYVITTKEKKYLEYLFQVLSREVKILKKQGKGSQTKFLTIGMLTEVKTYSGNNETMEAFYKLTDPLFEKQMNVMQQNQQLSTLRDWLLPLLMNGQVKVGEVAENLSVGAEPEVNYGG